MFERCVWDGNTSLDGGGYYHVGVESRIDVRDSTFRNNQATRWGGGTYIYSGAPIVTNTLFEDNVADSGGGGAVAQQDLFNTNQCIPGLCEAIYENCVFRRNESPNGYGGGLQAQYFAHLILRDVTFEGNSAYSGGGLAMMGLGSDDSRAGRVSLDRCVFQGNDAVAFGGGVYAQNDALVTAVRSVFLANASGSSGGGMHQFNGGAATLVSDRFVANRAGTGGGLDVGLNVDVLVANSLFAGNSAGVQRSGGALWFREGSTAIIGTSTFANNVATITGSVLVAIDSTIQFTNSILWGNQHPVAGAAISASAGASVAVDYTVVQGGWTGMGNMISDPQFIDPTGPDGLPGTGDEDFHVAWSSPAMDSANPALLPADVTDLDGDGDVNEPLPVDMLGDVRVYGSGLDRGALELGPVVCAPGTFSATGAPPCDPCPPGSAQPSSGATSCIACAPGTSAPTAGLSQCAPCPTLQFQPDPGQTACLLCSCDDANQRTTDTCDAVSGACQHDALCMVPTVSAWGALTFGLLLSACGTLVLRRRLPAVPT